MVGFFLRGGLSPVGQPESLRGNQEGEAWKTGSADAFRLSEKTNTQVEWWVETILYSVPYFYI